MKKRDVILNVRENAFLIELLIDSYNSAIGKDHQAALGYLEKIRSFERKLKAAIEDAEKLGLQTNIKNYRVIYSPQYKEWSKPQIMSEVFPSKKIDVAVDMKILPEVFEDIIELPLRKAMKILISKGWITDYSSGNYKDAEGVRYNVFVDRKNVAFIRFDKKYLTKEHKKLLMKGNMGEYMIYTPVWPDKPVADVEAELAELAEKLPNFEHFSADQAERE